MSPNHLDQLRDELRRTLGPHAVIVRADDLATYDADATMIVARTPELVVLPADPAQASTAVRLAVAAGLPVVARGAGTGIAGGAVPVRGGLVLSTARMDRVEQIEPRSRRALVGAGVVNADLNAQLAPLGFQFAPDPSSQRASTIGGNLATNAGGPHCLKYGVTSNHVLGVELVRPDGSLVWTNDGVSEWAGYDLTGLVVGSEGTFGLVTRAIVRLTPLPEAVRVVQALFPQVVAASSAVSRVIAAGLLPTSLEVMDHNAIRAVNGAYGLGLPEAEGTTLLIIEVDGVEDGLDATLADILAICRTAGAFELRPAREPAEQARIWAARKAVAGAVGRLAPAYLLVDTVVPRTRLPLMMEHVERLRHEYQMEVCNVLHAGDGNLHPLVLYDPRDPDQTERAHAIASAVLKLSIAQGGVITGEHGVGLEKQAYLPLLFSPAELALHATVYQVFNPGDQFNPAKIFPLDQPPLELAALRQARLAAACGSGDHGDTAITRLAGLVGADHVQTTPSGGLFVTPGTLDELTATVATAGQLGMTMRPSGAGQPPAAGLPEGTLQISTVRLDRVLAYEPDDLTIAVEAGMTLATLRATLAAHGQDLPLEWASAATTTIGELVAWASDGPRRLGYGSMRDWVIGLTIIEADGTPVRLGAQVVKNATGYDLVKLLVGSRGTLGLIATVSLRVFPRPQATATCLISLATRHAAFALIDNLVTTRLLPTAVEYLTAEAPASHRLLLRAEGHPDAVKRHLTDLQALATQHGALTVTILTEQAEAAQWDAAVQAGPGGPPATALIRLCTPPVNLAEALDHAEASAAQAGLSLTITARAVNGVAYLRVMGDPLAAAALYQTLVTRWQYVQLLEGAALAQLSGPALGQISAPALQLALKRACDPTASWPD